MYVKRGASSAHSHALFRWAGERSSEWMVGDVQRGSDCQRSFNIASTTAALTRARAPSDPAYLPWAGGSLYTVKPSLGVDLCEGLVCGGNATCSAVRGTCHCAGRSADEGAIFPACLCLYQGFYVVLIIK